MLKANKNVSNGSATQPDAQSTCNNYQTQANNSLPGDGLPFVKHR
jgi:hypothetical protein